VTRLPQIGERFSDEPSAAARRSSCGIEAASLRMVAL
jgi:hypothetical protein